jgi:hypothetical protein
MLQVLQHYGAAFERRSVNEHDCHTTGLSTKIWYRKIAVDIAVMQPAAG